MSSLVGKVTEDTALIQKPFEHRPQIVKRADFEADWTGRVVLMARCASLADLARRFDITWFLQAMQKYRRLLAEVLLASFFLQLFALVTPLFLQVVTDKVLTHRGYTTLDVLVFVVFGLITVSVFETVLAGLRTYVFSHTTNRIDVELGARLFRHLVALLHRASGLPCCGRPFRGPTRRDADISSGGECPSSMPMGRKPACSRCPPGGAVIARSNSW